MCACVGVHMLDCRKHIAIFFGAGVVLWCRSSAWWQAAVQESPGEGGKGGGEGYKG